MDGNEAQDLLKGIIVKDGPRHKYDYGQALIVGGAALRAGAARLAARAALRIGAGLVTLGWPAEVMGQAGGPDALMRARVDGAADLSAALDDRRVTALLLGPGLGIDRAGALIDTALCHPRLGRGYGVVLDADALTAMAADDDRVFALTAGQPIVLTPHAGEFARLFGQADGPVQDQVGQAARRAGCVVVRKGPQTLISDAGAAAVTLDNGNAPWLATAGSGDVLAGMIAGLLARGVAPARAAWAGVTLHAAAARRCGPGLIADDLPEALPGVFRDLGL